MEIITHPHPTLSYKSKTIQRINSELRDIVAEMFELMYAAKGVGLAANQVNLPLRLFVVNTSSDAEEGEELVFINPVLSKGKGSEIEDEGCLSLPNVYGPVNRSRTIHVEAFGMQGNTISADLDGLLARVVQHETDHLDGIMFLDRMNPLSLKALEADLQEFELEFTSRRQGDIIESDEVIYAKLATWEDKFCTQSV
ncbi:MAG: peptide deformylase [Planctomycetaceae bacterium]|jgi:peptide deformylase|nr:peptide deformylase [Planctomycetaceae bacterium]MBT4013002.1 peptide deformylase [Planctomycetaceae bacterium]MBT4844882.1 peptide deformylase [Planctomycetaceae bacterium]MBT5125565.1 peptide deformylase [Planctomycetaceae bacterium]MBT5599996.1 peptide deformylase [Planctomycetaceae bacterium]